MYSFHYFDNTYEINILKLKLFQNGVQKRQLGKMVESQGRVFVVCVAVFDGSWGSGVSSWWYSSVGWLVVSS